MTDPVKVAKGVGAFVAALGLRFERNDDGRVQRVDMWGIPVFDRARGERRRARRAARREAREEKRRDSW